MKNNLVLKLTAVLVILLTVVLYKMNDFYRQEKLFQTEAQVKKQITSIKTTVATQLSTIKNVVSSFEIEIKESQINWVQLNPFFAMARLQKKSDGSYSVSQTVARSGTAAEKWNNAYLEKALSVRKSNSDKAIQARLFADSAGNKFTVLIFNGANQQQIALVGGSDVFQKFFDQDRDGQMISLLITSDHVLVAHTESDYVASLSDEMQLSSKKYIIEKEEIAGTNLTAMSYALKKSVAAAWVVPWSVVGLICGFGFILIGLLFYGLEPIEKKVERYKKQEREQIFKDVLQSQTQKSSVGGVVGSTVGHISNLNQKQNASEKPEIELIHKTRADSIQRAQEAFSEPTEAISDVSIQGPLKQALANLDSVLNQEAITVQKEISTNLAYPIYYGAFMKAFEHILRNSIEALQGQKDKTISIRAYDIDQQSTVVEIQDNGIGLPSESKIEEKIWQPFFTTKSKADHMGLGLTESLSTIRRAGGDLSIESRLDQPGVLVKMVMQKEINKKEEVVEAVEMKNDMASADELEKTVKTQVQFVQPEINFDEEINISLDSDHNNQNQEAFVMSDSDLDLDLEKVLALDEAEAAQIFAPEKVNLNTFPKKLNVEFKTPNLKFEKKSYQVDEFETRVRRPEKS